jgi:hypothetical protein
VNANERNYAALTLRGLGDQLRKDAALGPCECRQNQGTDHAHQRDACGRPSVRVVTLHGYRPFQDMQVPMCEACASFLESEIRKGNV